MVGKFKLTKSTAEVYHIKLTGERYGWADITIESWNGGGSFKAISDFGDYSYQWSSIGSGTFKEFLAQLHDDYFMRKCKGRDYYVIDSGATIEALKERILYLRRQEDLSKHEARHLFNTLKNELIESYQHLLDWIKESTAPLCNMEYIADCCFEDFDMRTKPCPQCTAFWDLIWPCLIESFEEEKK